MGRIVKIEKYIGRVIRVILNKKLRHEKNSRIANNYGIDSKPPVGSKVVCVSVNDKECGATIATYPDEKDEIAEPGETRIYSKSGAYMHAKNDGSVVAMTKSGANFTMTPDGVFTVENATQINLGGSAKSFVTFEDLDKLWQKFLTFFGMHTHPTTTGNTSKMNEAITPDISDISGLKSKTVKTNG